MRNLVGGVMTSPYERQVLGLTSYYSGWCNKQQRRIKKHPGNREWFRGVIFGKISQ